MQEPESKVTLRVANKEFSHASSYEVESDIFTPCDAFSFTVPNNQGEMAGQFEPGQAFELILDSCTQMTGRIDSVSYQTDWTGSHVTVSGRDNFQFLVDCSCEPRRHKGKNLKEMAEALTSQWITNWIVDNDSSRSKLLAKSEAQLALARRAERRARQEYKSANMTANLLDAVDKVNKSLLGLEAQVSVIQTRYKVYKQIEEQVVKMKAETKRADKNLEALRAKIYGIVKAEPGDTAIDILSKLAKKAGFLLWCAPDGSGIIAKPEYTLPPMYNLRLYPSSDSRSAQNNILEANITRDWTDRYSSITVKGSGGNTVSSSGEDSLHSITVTDPDVPIEKPLIIQDGDCKNRDQTRARAQYELDERRFKSLVLEYTVRSHFSGGIPWQIDTIANVDDAIAGISGNFYITRRKFSGDENGTKTELTLHEAGVFLT